MLPPLPNTRTEWMKCNSYCARAPLCVCVCVGGWGWGGGLSLHNRGATWLFLHQWAHLVFFKSKMAAIIGFKTPEGRDTGCFGILSWLTHCMSHRHVDRQHVSLLSLIKHNCHKQFNDSGQHHCNTVQDMDFYRLLWYHWPFNLG